MENGQIQSPPPKCTRVELSSEEEQEEIWKDCMNEMYVMQHFQTSAEEVTDTIFNLSVHHFERLFPVIKNSLKQIMCHDAKSENSEIDSKIHAGLKSLVKSFYSNLERNSDVMTLYLKKNIVMIPENTVLTSDLVQSRYKTLVKSLNEGKENCVKNADDQVFTEENTADLLTLEAENLRLVLKQRKLEKLQLESAIEEKNLLVKRLDNLEGNLNQLNSSFPVPVRDFVLNNIAAASDISTFKL